MEEILSSAGLISLFTLTFMEVVLGIDNIIFVNIVVKLGILCRFNRYSDWTNPKYPSNVFLHYTIYAHYAFS